MRLLFSLALILILPACASRVGDGEWPSLAYRPGEDRSAGPCEEGGMAGAAETELATLNPAPVTMPPPAPAPKTLDGIDAALAAVEADWENAVARAEDAVARARGQRSGPVWGSAQIALSRLEAVFGQTAPLDAEIMGLMAPFAATGGAPEALQAIDTRMKAFRARHLERFDALRAGLGAQR
ncbi:MAG: hypothetical protein WA979_11140 [Pacificimonas sp.]